MKKNQSFLRLQLEISLKKVYVENTAQEDNFKLGTSEISHANIKKSTGYAELPKSLIMSMSAYSRQ